MRKEQIEKEKQDSQSASDPPSSVAAAAAPHDSDSKPRSSSNTTSSDDHSLNLGHVSLGSLSTHSPGQSRESAFAQESTKRKGKLSSLIYGTHEGQQMDKDIEKSFSQVLARGKYVHSIVFHTVKPDRVDEYVDLVGDWYPKIAGVEENHVHLVGSWRTEVGDCDTFGSSRKPFPVPLMTRITHRKAGAAANQSIMQSIYGSISAIRAITNLSTALPHTRTSLLSTASSKSSSPTSRPH